MPRSQLYAVFALLTAFITTIVSHEASAQTAPSAAPAATAVPAAVPAATATPAASGAPAPTSSASPAPTPSPTPIVQFNGFGDFSYTKFSGNPLLVNPNGLPPGNAVTTRIFDKFQNVPVLQSIDLQGQLNTPIGAKLEIMAGPDADGYASTGQSTTAGFNVIQAYGTYTKGPFELLVGKFNTLAGYEVNDTPSNPNFSRSYQFAYGEPFTHTGGRLVYTAPSGKYVIEGGLNAGWDNWEFIGGGTTAEFSTLVNVSPALSVQATTYNGHTFTVPPPGPPIVRGNRMLYDFVMTAHATPALTLVAVYDTAVQLETAYGSSYDGSPNAKWNSVAGYAEYALSSQWSVNLRGETFADVNGFRTHFAPGAQVNEGTVTVSWSSANGHYVLRAEGRNDHVAGNGVTQFAGFPTADGGFTNSSSSVALEGLIKF